MRWAERVARIRDKVAIVQMVLLTFPMNLVGCGLNDIYDYESDRRSPTAAGRVGRRGSSGGSAARVSAVWR